MECHDRSACTEADELLGPVRRERELRNNALFRDDFRRCTDSGGYPLNLMLFTGLPETGWEASWYASIEELPDPDKALARWLRRG